MDTTEESNSNLELVVTSGAEQQLAALIISGRESVDSESGQLQGTLDKLNELMCLYRCAIMEVETKFKVLNAYFSLQRDRNPISSITTRLKTFESIHEKMLRANIEPTIDALRENMHDIAGVRVICSFEDDVYLLADCLERQDDIVILKRKDYIENPKPNGYRSLHLIVEVPVFLPEGIQKVQVEVQLRTIAMEFWASLEHKLRYKKDIDPELLKATADALLQCAQLSSKLDSKMQNVRHMIDGFQLLSSMEANDGE